MPASGRREPPPLPAEALRWRCPAAFLGAPSTAGVPPDPRWLGDERARQTVRLALRIGGRSHHLLLRGAAGTGTGTLLCQCLDEVRHEATDLRDHVFVRRPDDPRRPLLLSLPAGRGRELVEALDEFADWMNTLDGCTRKEARDEVRSALAEVRAAGDSRGLRDHVRRLRKRVLADLPILTSEESLDDEQRVRCTEGYRGRLLRDASAIEGRPVVVLTGVHRRALLGGIDAPDGDDAPGLEHLVPGALVEADGGYCVVPMDALAEDGALTRELLETLRRGAVELRPSSRDAEGALADLRPDPIPISTRVIVVGSRSSPHGPLTSVDARRVFGLTADCGPDLPRDDALLRSIGGLLSSLCRRRGLLHLRAGAAARLVEEQVRDAEGRGLISTRFALLADRAREADVLARAAGRRSITAADVREAGRLRRWRINRAEERHRERLSRRRLRVETEGTAVGSVNGLLVYTLSGLRYGAPTRITATTAVGREGVINIEREAKLSGKTFDKGVYALVGWLRAHFCQTDPLGMVAMITCEQNYGSIDGDSASAAELVAILSHLAGAPVRQGVAMTGAISQRGEILSVGGVNEKIEGFYATCRDRGLTGDQGIVIPAPNAEDLVLDDEVVEAAREGRFRVWAVRTVGEAAEILTGLPAGAADAGGRYPRASLLGRAQRRLEAMSRRMFPPRKGARKGGGASSRSS